MPAMGGREGQFATFPTPPLNRRNKQYHSEQTENLWAWRNIIAFFLGVTLFLPTILKLIVLGSGLLPVLIYSFIVSSGD